jgi:predicted aspartyl protease
MSKDQLSELEIKENSNGELYFNIPDDVLDRLAWEEGDEIKFTEKDGGFVLTKVKYETIELDFDEEELLKYMMFAHEQNLSFNEFVEQALKEKIEELNNE